MYNAVTKFLYAIVLFAIVACGSGDRQNAEQLLAEAEHAIEHAEYSDAIALLDTIESTYPKQIDVRRKAMHIRPKAIEGATLKEIEKNDSAIVVLQSEYNQLSASFKTVSDPKLIEPYIVAKKAEKSLFETTGIQARITTDGDFYVITSLVGVPIKHTSVSLIYNGGEVTTSVAEYDGDRNYRSGNTEMITFIKQECDTLGKFALDNEGRGLTLRFNGNKKHNVKLSKVDTDVFALTYKYSTIISDLKSAMRRKEFLEQQLLLARDQIARTLDENSLK